MPSPQLAPLTPREQAVADFLRRPRVADLCMVIAAALVGFAARGWVQGICGSPYSGFEGGAGYSSCEKALHGYTWLVFVGGAVVIAVLIRALLGRRRYARRIGLLAVVAAAIANSILLTTFPTGAP
jgi:hypothetical protein